MLIVSPWLLHQLAGTQGHREQRHGNTMFWKLKVCDGLCKANQYFPPLLKNRVRSNHFFKGLDNTRLGTFKNTPQTYRVTQNIVKFFPKSSILFCYFQKNRPELTEP